LNQAGYTSWGSFCDIGHCPVSAIRWALGPQESEPVLGFDLNPGGDWSWSRTRNTYFSALTSTSPTAREMNFADVFRGLGQVMHLVQDMSVPEHVRNDGHVKKAYEEWVRDSQTSTDPARRAIWQNAMANPIFFDMSALGQPAAFSETLAPVANLFDTNQYDGTNPNITLHANIGLAEYTNANFVSPDSLFSSFPYPAEKSTIKQDYIIPDPVFSGQTVARQYYKKVADGDTGYRLAGVGYLQLFLEETESVSVYAVIPPMDSHVYADYAQRLLPRAIGYSAGLLNYFFRGKLGAQLTPAGIRVKNLSDEEMTYYIDQNAGKIVGAIEIYYDDTKGERHLLATYDIAMSSTPVIPPGGSTELIGFARPSDNIAESRYIIVFRGRLGNEDGAVAGRVYVPSVYYASTQNGVDRILKVNLDTTGRTVIYDNDDPNILLGRFSFSPDEKQAAVNVLTPNDPNAGIFLLDSASSGLTYLTKGNSPAWSPDGRRIAFSYEKGSGFPAADEQLAVYDLTAGTSADLPIPDHGSYIYAAWSPDGGSLAYSRWPGGGENCRNQAAIVVLTGTLERVITCDSDTENYVVDSMPAWSPDGTEIAFARAQGAGKSYALYKVNVATGLVTRLTGSAETGFDEQSPTWSPDGATIAISSNRGGNLNVWLVGANGEGYIRNLTGSNAESDGMPVFAK
jgi:hypothetical protein